LFIKLFGNVAECPVKSTFTFSPHHCGKKKELNLLPYNISSGKLTEQIKQLKIQSKNKSELILEKNQKNEAEPGNELEPFHSEDVNVYWEKIFHKSIKHNGSQCKTFDQL